MAVEFDNQRFNIAWKYMRYEIERVQRIVWNDEDLNGQSNSLGQVVFLNMALTYCFIIYEDITLPNREVGAEDWDDVRGRFNWHNHVRYFSDHGIVLKKIGDFFDLEVLSALNVDTQVLIDAQPDNDTPIYP